MNLYNVVIVLEKFVLELLLLVMKVMIVLLFWIINDLVWFL